MEVLLIKSKSNLDQVVYLLDTGQLEFIFLNDSDDLQDLIFQDFVTTDWFFV